MNSKDLTNTVRRSQRSLHNTLLWWGGACVLIWALSGLTHPLMSWFGPKQANYRPPTMDLTLVQSDQAKADVTFSELTFAQLQLLAKTLINELDQGLDQNLNKELLEEHVGPSQGSYIEGVSIAKVVPSKQGPLLQLTRDQNQPRRYFPLAYDAQEGSEFKRSELDDFDQTQARWLASYYTGRSEADILSVTLQTEFDGNYPWVNRLLPVYRITFDGDDALSAYIHTESLQLAGLANNARLNLQWVFRTFHTFNFLDDQDNVRVSAILMAMFVLLGMAISGLGLVLLIRQRRITNVSRRWHRRIGYVIWLPLLAWSISGGYHLIQSAYLDQPSGLRLSPNFSVNRLSELRRSNTDTDEPLFVSKAEYYEQWAGRAVLGISLLDINGQLVYRLSLDGQAEINKSRDSHHQQLLKKYRGAPLEKESVYLDALTMAPVSLNDKRRAVVLATEFANLSKESVSAVELVTRFGPDYDFRNKRLPVWKVSFNDELQRQLFIDPATALLVDQTRAIDRAERWSFSVLHKWNHLIPFTGRFKRDVVIVMTLTMLMLMTMFGGLMAWRRIRQNKLKR